MENRTWILDRERVGERLDIFIAGDMEQTRSAVQHWIEQGYVTVSGLHRPKNYRLREGDRVKADIPDAAPYQALAQEIPLDIVFEDGDLLVVNKPKGMVVHPAAGNPDGTLVNALLAHCGDSLSGINGVMRPGIVHRIDKDTSGLLIVAKNDMAHTGLAEQIKAHSFTREYEAVVTGHLSPPCGTVDQPIGRHPAQRKKMAVIQTNSKRAVTHYETLADYPGFAYIRLRLETGRTHQIRVHMAWMGHPLAGDTVYGGARQSGFEGQCLHARRIGFLHPRENKWMEFSSDLPAYFTTFLEEIGMWGD